MSQLKYEPFGQSIGQSDNELAELAHPARRAVLNIGVGIFWLLVVGIVSARAAYFNPDFARAFENVAAAVPHFIRSIFAA